ncbi:MAG: peptidoglycan recognition family protein [Phycisphaerales bacterium]
MSASRVYSCEDVTRVARQKRATNGLTAGLKRLRRPQVVWLSLVASMTAAGGVMAALDGGRAPRMDGVALAAATRTTQVASIESVFRTRAPLERERWQYIVIHDSGAAHGSAQTLAAQHEALGLKGLGYHFVIGNGNGSGDGEVFVGHRWMDQAFGAHAAGPDGEWYNLRSIGICLVGDGDRRLFTPTQVSRLADLVSALCRELNIPEDRVILHRSIAGTTSPGRLFPEAALRERLTALRAGGAATEAR